MKGFFRPSNENFSGRFCSLKLLPTLGQSISENRTTKKYVEYFSRQARLQKKWTPHSHPTKEWKKESIRYF